MPMGSEEESDPPRFFVLKNKWDPDFFGVGMKLQDAHVGCMAYFYVFLRGFPETIVVYDFGLVSYDE